MVLEKLGKINEVQRKKDFTAKPLRLKRRSKGFWLAIAGDSGGDERRGLEEDLKKRGCEEIETVLEVQPESWGVEGVSELQENRVRGSE